VRAAALSSQRTNLVRHARSPSVAQNGPWVKNLSVSTHTVRDTYARRNGLRTTAPRPSPLTAVHAPSTVRAATPTERPALYYYIIFIT